MQAAARHGARMGNVAQQCSACYAASAASSAIDSDPNALPPHISGEHARMPKFHVGEQADIAVIFKLDYSPCFCFRQRR